MQTPPPIDTPLTFRLAPGQTMLQPLQAGTCVQVERGRLRVAEPARWLAGYALPSETEVSGGSCHVLQRGGWVRLRAEDEVRGRLLLRT
jgi:hypothetical protein